MGFMFNFFHTIFIKITSVIATAIIAVGLVSVPQMPNEIYKVPNEELIASSSINQEVQGETIKSTSTIKTEENHETKNIVTPQQTPTTNKNEEPEISNSISTTTEIKTSQPEKIDYQQTKYALVSYSVIEKNGKVCAYKIDSDAVQLEGSVCGSPDVATLTADGSRITFIIQLLNLDRKWVSNKKVLVTSENGEINQEIEANEYGVFRFDFATKISGNGYITIRVNDGFSKDIKFLSFAPVSNTTSVPTTVQLTGINQFYGDIINLPMNGECGARIGAGNLPNGISYIADIGCYYYKGGVMEKYKAVYVLGESYPLDMLIGRNIKITPEVKTRLKMLNNCEFMAKPWNTEIIHSISISSSVTSIFQREGLPIPISQVLNLHPSYQKYCEMDAISQQEYANKLDALGISENIAFLIWGWQPYEAYPISP